VLKTVTIIRCAVYLQYHIGSFMNASQTV